MQEMKIGENILFLRRNQGLTQEELAGKLGVTNQAVSKWESGQCCPDIALMPEIAAIFGVTIDDLFGFEPDKMPKDTILELRKQIFSLPKREGYLYMLRIVFALHAMMIAKNSSPDFDKPEWFDSAIKNASEGKWGYSCVNLPDITTFMREDSVFWSGNRNPHMDNSHLYYVYDILRIFGNLCNLKFFSALYELTVQDNDKYAEINEISSKCGLPVTDCKPCAEGELGRFLKVDNKSGEPAYRIEGMYMQFMPLFSMLSNR